MARFIIEGGNPLTGELSPQGAKNEALQVICATLLTSQKITISNIPEISDVLKLIEILRSLGTVIERPAKGVFTFQSDEIRIDHLKSAQFFTQAGSLRGSLMILSLIHI